MSDTMLHGILQMPPELWSNDAIDIAQRHGRYLEASKRIIELERERDEARRECNAAQDGWSRALDERDEAREELARVRKELVAANRGAETNAKVNQGLCAKLADAERERDEARRELAEMLHRLSVWKSAASQMKKQLSFAPPFQQGMDSKEEAK